MTDFAIRIMEATNKAGEKKQALNGDNELNNYNKEEISSLRDLENNDKMPTQNDKEQNMRKEADTKDMQNKHAEIEKSAIRQRVRQNRELGD